MIGIKEHMAYLKDNPQGYWFKRKLYGWGWTPAKWQGWVTLLVFVGLLVLNSFRLTASQDQTTGAVALFVVENALLVTALLVVCYKTGESPKWMWGLPKKDGDGDENHAEKNK